MPLRFYDNNDWRTPSEIRVRDNDNWNNVEIGYVYDLGTWKVVFPDPITPTYTLTGYNWTRDPGQPAEIDVELTTQNTDTVIIYLYNSSTPTGTPVQTAVLNPFTQVGNDTLWKHTFFVTAQGTYSTKVELTSITETTISFNPGPLTIVYPTVSVLTAGTNDNTDFFVTWTSTNQGSVRISVQRLSDGFSQGGALISSSTARSYSGLLDTPLLANTQYIIYVTVDDPNFDGSEEASRVFTSVNNPPAVVDITSVIPTCGNVTVNWTNSNVSSGTITLLQAYAIEQGMFYYEVVPTPPGGVYNFTPPTNSYTFPGLMPRDPSSATQGYYRIEAVGVNSAGQTGVLETVDFETLQASISNVPTFTATSSFYGNDATLTWTHATPNCTTRSGYTIQYKLASSSTWSLVSNTIGANTTSYNMSTAGITLTPNTAYNFRIFARSPVGNSGYTFADLTTSNNPYQLLVYTSPLNANTFSSVSVIAQLQNINGVNVSNSGVSVSFSATSGRGSFSSTSATTNSNGLAEVTYTTNSTTGNITFTGTSSGLQSDTYIMSVSLSPGRIPLLSRTNNIYGYDVSHSNYDSSWTYSSTVDSPGFIWSGSVSSTAFGVYIPTRNNTLPSASQDANYVYCTTGSWSPAPSVSTTVTSSRAGYNDGSGSVTGSPTNVYTVVYQYDWYYYDANNVEQYWGAGDAANNGRRAKGTIYNNSIKGRLLYCRVTASRNHSGTITGGNSANSNKITGS